MSLKMILAGNRASSIHRGTITERAEEDDVIEKLERGFERGTSVDAKHADFFGLCVRKWPFATAGLKDKAVSEDVATVSETELHVREDLGTPRDRG
jgi:hypothetical protein